VVQSLFQQEAVKRGVLLLATHNLTGADDTGAIKQTLEVDSDVLKTLASWLKDPEPQASVRAR
jgi:hypothetical protein